MNRKKDNTNFLKSELESLLKSYLNNNDEINIEHYYKKESISLIDINEICEPIFDLSSSLSNNFDDFSDSIIKDEIYQPLIVRNIKNKYEIILGRNIFYFCKKTNIPHVRCIVKNLTDEEALLSISYAVKEMYPDNFLIKCQLFNYLRNILNFKNKDISNFFKISEGQVSNIVKINSLNLETIDLIKLHNLSYGHVKAFERLNEENINYVINRIINENLSVRETENLVNNLKNNKKTRKGFKIKDNKIILIFENNYERDKALKHLEKLIRKNKINIDS